MMNELINHLLPSIEHFRVGDYWVAFFAAMLETTVGVGLILPGSTLILILGAFAARGYLDVGDLLWFAVLGAVLGDNVNYYLGKRYGARWLKGGLWLLKAEYMEKARHFMNAHGAKGVFLGRFVPSVKEIMPLIAGSLNMKPRTFMIWNVLGAIGWGLEWVLGGYILGQSLKIATLWLSRAGLFFAILLIFVIIFYLCKWRIARKGKAFWTIVSSLWHSLKAAFLKNEYVLDWTKKHPRTLSFCRARLDPARFSGLTLTLSTLALIYVVALFAGIVEDLITSDPIVAADIRIANLMSIMRSGGLTHLFFWITLLGKFQVILVFILVAMALLLLWRKKYCIVPLLAAAAGSQMFTYLAKLAFRRPRPEMAVYVEHTYSFPSGHATIACAFYGFMGYLLIRTAQSWQRKVNLFFGTLFLILAIGFSRIYLGVHYVSDVWGGYLVGTMWLIIAAALSEWLSHNTRAVPALSPVRWVRPISLLLIIMAILFYAGFSMNYAPPRPPVPAAKTAVVVKSTDIFTDNQLKYTGSLIGERQEPINFIFLAEDDLRMIGALQRAGWTLTDKANIVAFLKALKALIINKPYPTAPISPTFWNTKIQNLGFAKVPGLNWLKNARHIKIWRTDFQLGNGDRIYVAVVNSNHGFDWGVIPKINPDMDTDREKLYQSLVSANELESHLKVQLVKPMIGTNFIGESFFTDGKAYIVTVR